MLGTSPLDLPATVSSVSAAATAVILAAPIGTAITGALAATGTTTIGRPTTATCLAWTRLRVTGRSALERCWRLLPGGCVGILRWCVVHDTLPTTSPIRTLTLALPNHEQEQRHNTQPLPHNCILQTGKPRHHATVIRAYGN
jgi:hypothetical protein